MSAAGKVAKFVVESVVKRALESAGTEIGNALGKRIGALLRTPEPTEEAPEPEKDATS